MRVLLVEDDLDLGTAIKQTLTQEAYVIDWAIDGTEATRFLHSQWTQYTLAIFDWMIPGVSGIELCQQLRATGSTLPVLMLTVRSRLADKVTGLDAGADDYLVKPFGMEELLARLRALRRRSPQLQSEKLQVGSLVLDYATRTVTSQTKTGEIQSETLTAKEFQLLEYLMKHPNQVVTRDQILNQVWEIDAEPISNVVAVQIRRLRRKLAPCGYNTAIESLRGLGYRFVAADER